MHLETGELALLSSGGVFFLFMIARAMFVLFFGGTKAAVAISISWNSVFSLARLFFVHED
jgi:hypothetical protein